MIKKIKIKNWSIILTITSLLKSSEILVVNFQANKYIYKFIGLLTSLMSSWGLVRCQKNGGLAHLSHCLKIKVMHKYAGTLEGSNF